MRDINPIERLKKEHSLIIKEVGYFESSLIRVGNHLDTVKRFIELFDNKIQNIIKLEESVIFPSLREQIARDDSLFVMNYTHDIIVSEFEKLRNALTEKDIYNLHKSAKRLVDVLRFHIEKEDRTVLKEVKKRLGAEQIKHLSHMFVKTIGREHYMCTAKMR